MSRRPFFSIAIPAKNRPDRLRNAVRSVLEQTFTDFEVIICDNSDDADTAGTAAVARELDDPRIIYIRTNGRLAMPDNWERSVADARGEFVGILTDRSVYHPHALERVHAEITRTGAPLVGWLPDHYGRGPSGREFRRRRCSGRPWEVESRRLLQFFVHGKPKHSAKLVPKLMSCVCSRAVIDEVRSSVLGRICPPVCPDYTSGYLMLAHTDRVLLLDDTLFVSCGSGNGSAFRRRGPLASRFLRDLGMSWRDLVDRMPTDACFSWSLVLNDLMRVKERLPERFADCEIDRVQYYLGCLADYVRAAGQGADLLEDYDALIEGLNRESEEVQDAVRSRYVYLQAAGTVPPEVDVEDVPAAGDGGEDDTGFPPFDNVFEAMAWAAQHPRTPKDVSADTAPIVMPELDSVKMARVARKKRPTPRNGRGATTEVW
jgi:glycosyltransferase involved in cell wall biosynthesis